MTVRFGNHKINLFSCTEGGICPVSDKVLDDEVKQATKDESYQTIKSLNNQINQYYRVVGIVFFRAIVGQHAIAPKAMPRFWRNGKCYSTLRALPPCIDFQTIIFALFLSNITKLSAK